MSKTATILGRRYRIEFCRLPEGTMGECDDPTKRDKAIRISKGMTTQDTAETVIHESLHAAGWHIDEEFVSQYARDVAAILKKLGLLAK